jgi:hypothetical protein
MGLKGLAEGIILQSIDDLWVKHLKEDCITFFKGKGFRDCAKMAGMTTSDQIKLLNLVKSVIENQREKNLQFKPFGQIMERHGLRQESLTSIM